MVPNPAQMRLGKVKLTWIWTWQEIWRATKKICTNILAAKVRLGGTWYHCWTGTQKRTWHLEFSLPQSLPVELIFRDLRPTRHQEIWNKEYSPSVKGYSHWGIFKLDRKMSTGPERLHPWVLREPCKVTPGCLWKAMGEHGRFLRSESKYHPSSRAARNSLASWQL